MRSFTRAHIYRKLYTGACLCMFLTCGKLVHAQPGIMINADTIAEKMYAYSYHNPSALLYIHFDKTLYTNNEDVWFSAYLLNSGPLKINTHSVLSVSLVESGTNRIWLENKFLMAEGRAFGNMALPDTIPGGDFFLLAHTDVVTADSVPLAQFIQPIIIKNTREPAFNMRVELVDSNVTAGSPVKIRVAIKDPGTIKEPVLHYMINNTNEAVVKMDRQKNDPYIINVLPEQLMVNSPVITGSIISGNNENFFRLPLPSAKKKERHIRFYPEGGNLVHGLACLVAWEATGFDGEPWQVKGILYKNGKPSDTIETDHSGTGKFWLNALEKDKLDLRLIPFNSVPLVLDSLFPLPPVLPMGITIHIDQAVAEDTLNILLQNTVPGNVHVLLHNTKEAFGLFPVFVNAAGRRMKISLGDLPRGPAMITLLDSLGRPLAERLFFAHYNKVINVQVETDKEIYNKRDSISVRIKLTDDKNRPVSASISVACIQNNRIDNMRMIDIENYSLLTHELQELPFYPEGKILNDIPFLENILLVRGWRRYTWQDLLTATASDTARQFLSLEIKGQVLDFGKRLRTPAMIGIFRDSSLNIITTDSSGFFLPGNGNLVNTSGKKTWMIPMQKNKSGVTIIMDDPYKKISRKLADKTPYMLFTKAAPTNNTSPKVTDMENYHRLSDVTVTASRDNSIWGKNAALQPNACGDYIGVCNVLNCELPGHIWRIYKPIKGHTYLKHVFSGDGEIIANKLIIYTGCVLEEEKRDALVLAPAIFLAKEFYRSDFGLTAAEPRYISTLYWSPDITVTENNGASFVFNASDISGPFRIVLQGTSSGNVLSGEKIIRVK